MIKKAPMTSKYMYYCHNTQRIGANCVFAPVCAASQLWTALHKYREHNASIIHLWKDKKNKTKSQQRKMSTKSDIG